MKFHDSVFYSSILLSTFHLGVRAIPITGESLLARDAQDPNPYPDKQRLTFNADGTFKVTVFSDLHFGENPWDDWGPQHDASSLQLMRTVLGDEKPDYVVLNGDLVTGENTFKENSTSLIDEIMGPLNDAKVPFSTTQGNHDNAANISHLDEIQREQKVAPLSYTRVAPPGVGGTEGPGTYWVPIYAKSQDQAPALILWFFDSRGGYAEGSTSTGVPSWVDPTVAQWIQNETATMEAAWGPADNRGALAFVHIPPHVIQAVQTNLNNSTDPGLNDDLLGDGSAQTAGQDDPFWNALNQYVKNLHAVVSGHDHGNEWCAREPTKDVIFCFDKHSGYGGYGSPGWGYGVRNFVFKSPNATQGVDSWIRLEDGTKRAQVTLDGSYGR